MFYDFNTSTHAKWILTGEHSVLRGHQALVFPLKNKNLILRYNYSPDSLSVTCKTLNNINLKVLFLNVLQYAFKILNKNYNEISGNFELICDIPIGTGMGASAALCVAISRWLIHQNLLATENCEVFAKDLENIFHGKSSGLDIAGVTTQTGLIFQQGKYQTLKQTWSPIWYLSFCGEIGKTSKCIEKIEELFNTDPKKADNIDKKMLKSIAKARLSLENHNSESFILLKDAIDLACACFYDWGLVQEQLENHMQFLLEHGAVAVKPTGSGAGGHVLSLWKQVPTQLLAKSLLISC